MTRIGRVGIRRVLVCDDLTEKERAPIVGRPP